MSRLNSRLRLTVDLQFLPGGGGRAKPSKAHKEEDQHVRFGSHNSWLAARLPLPPHAVSDRQAAAAIGLCAQPPSCSDNWGRTFNAVYQGGAKRLKKCFEIGKVKIVANLIHSFQRFWRNFWNLGGSLVNHHKTFRMPNVGLFHGIQYVEMFSYPNGWGTKLSCVTF